MEDILAKWMKASKAGHYMATVEGLRGVIAIGDTIEECRQDLVEVIEGWIALRLKMGDSVLSRDWLKPEEDEAWGDL
jgi:predicted RNase H-like HicB family nuclease